MSFSHTAVQRRLPPLSILSILLLILGCGSGGSDFRTTTGTGDVIEQPGWTVHILSRALPKKKWTFLVYLNAANNLEPDGTLNVNQMEQIGSSDDVNIVVQWKRIGGLYDARGGKWSNTRRYVITKNPGDLAQGTANVQSPLLSENGNLDMGSADSLQAFVQWGVKAYPAEHYCLVLWDHGAGWRSARPTRATGSAASPALTRGFSYDDLTKHHIDTIQIPAAIDIGSAGLKWDLLTFDSSLMQMEEVAYQVRNQATYILGSEESPPEQGLPYSTLLGQLVAHPDSTPLDFGRQIAQETLDAYGPNSDTTQSVLDASQTAGVASSVDALGSALLAAQGQWGDPISAARARSETYGHGSDLYGANTDLTDFLDQLTQTNTTGAPFVNDPGVLTAVQGVRTALGRTILFNVNGRLHPRSHGLAIWAPTPDQYQEADQEQSSGFGQRYTALSFSQAAPNWVRFLENGPN